MIPNYFVTGVLAMIVMLGFFLLTVVNGLAHDSLKRAHRRNLIPNPLNPTKDLPTV